jgi:hypothetical protein
MEEDIRFINTVRGYGEVLRMIEETGKMSREDASKRMREVAAVPHKPDTLQEAHKLLVAAVWVYNELNIRSAK